MRVSIIVPARNEARRIVATLAPLQSLRAAGHEVIVVDGGSTDATLALATPLSDRAFVAPQGRARQMNAGARVASGDVLLFLHADSQLPEDGVAAIADGMPRTARRWGRFDAAIAGTSGMLPVVASMMNVRSRLTGIATGDQGIFVERALFDAVGGYPDQPLMEDIELSRRLKRAAGAPLCLAPRIVTSGRRWERDGPWRTIVTMWGIRFAYWRGADPGRARRPLSEWTPSTGHHAPGLRQESDPGAGEDASRGSDRRRRGRCDLCALGRAHARRCGTAARAAGLVDRIELWGAPDIDAPAFSRVARSACASSSGCRPVETSARECATRCDSALATGSRAILIGTDCPAMELSYLAQAVAALDDHAAVFGPAEDGGYVLVGLSRAVDAFSGIPWSSAETMAATRAKLAAQRVRWQELPTLWDVDSPADLARWQQQSAATAASADTPAG